MTFFALYCDSGDIVTEEEKRQGRCCFTGHRPEKLLRSEVQIRAALAQAIAKALADGKRTFLTGMARGVDIWAAEIVLKVRDADPSVHLICALPHPNFEKRWSRHWQQRYAAILQAADLVKIISSTFSISSYQKRNAWMVDHASLVIAVYSGVNGGTRKTIAYARQQGVPIDMIVVPDAPHR